MIINLDELHHGSPSIAIEEETIEMCERENAMYNNLLSDLREFKKHCRDIVDEGGGGDYNNETVVAELCVKNIEQYCRKRIKENKKIIAESHEDIEYLKDHGRE